jgi:hypothetical protein
MSGGGCGQLPTAGEGAGCGKYFAGNQIEIFYIDRFSGIIIRELL